MASAAAALSWGAWTEIGVSGWSRTHADWAVDLEPLIVFTAWLGDRDPRLRDEALDWCIRNARHVSRVRLKNLLHMQPSDVREAFGEFAATVSQHISSPWPGGTEPRPYLPTGRSAPPALERPAAVWLRVRALFGVGARSEILRVLLSTATGPLSIATIAERAGFTKRNVADECDALAAAGLLTVRVHGNRFAYALAKSVELEALLGELPALRPPWQALLDVTRHLVNLEKRAAEGSPTTLPVEVTKTLRLLDNDVRDLGLEPPKLQPPLEQQWPALHRQGSAWLTAWARGEWPAASSTP